MTNEEAANVLRIMATGIKLKGYTELWLSSFKEAYEMAIKVLEERPKGEWITRHKLNSFGQDVVCFECNKCGEYKVPLYHLLITEPLKVCPNCGADMRKGGAE